MAPADFLVIALEDTDPYAAIDLDLAERIHEATTADAKCAEVSITSVMRKAATVLTEACTEARRCCAAGLIRRKSERKDPVGPQSCSIDYQQLVVDGSDFRTYETYT